MVDLSTESLLTLVEAAKTIPPARRGKKTHLSTLLRWILYGVKAPSGEIVCLEATRLGGRWLPSREALQRFSERLTPNLVSRESAVPRSLASRERASRRAGQELEKLGM
jgi:hypothetical protein